MKFYTVEMLQKIKIDDNTVSRRMCKRWFQKLEAGDFDHALGAPFLIFRTIIQQNYFLTTSKITENFNFITRRSSVFWISRHLF